MENAARRYDRICTRQARDLTRTGKDGKAIGIELGVSDLPTVAVNAMNEFVSDIAETRHIRSAPVIMGQRSTITLRHLWLIAEAPRSSPMT